MKKITAYVTLGLVVVMLAVIGIAGVSMIPRPRVYAMNVTSPTSCVSGIVYFVDVGSKAIITPVIDAKTDKPKHCE